MNDTFDNYYQLIKAQFDAIHNLTIDTCEMCGGSYTENLDGATSYFAIDGKRFKIKITAI